MAYNRGKLDCMIPTLLSWISYPPLWTSELKNGKSRKRVVLLLLLLLLRFYKKKSNVRINWHWHCSTYIPIDCCIAI